MVLRNWLSGWKIYRSRNRNTRRSRQRFAGGPQPLETRTLLSAISFTQQSGASNPLNGIDLGFASAPTLGDLDGDGDLDLIAGNSDGNFKYYRNTGTATAPVFTEQTGVNNPLNGVDLGFYSNPSLGDLDGDGDLDLFAGKDDGTFKYYRNTGTATAPAFTEQTGVNNPLNGIDLGFASAPTLGDLDGDGDLDLFTGKDDGTFKYYRNTGTATAPVFTEQTGVNNPLNGIDAGLYSTPTLGDLDGDGDLDLFAGEENGTFKYYRNTGTATAPVFTEQTGANNPLNGIDVGLYSTPTLGDLDGDGDLDLLAGEDDGVFNDFLNTTVPVNDLGFTERTGAANPLNGFDLGNYSTPILGDLDGDGDLDLIAGEFGGTLKYYRNTGTATSPVFTEQTGANNPLNGLDAGTYSAVTLGDLDGDGDLDLVAGNSDGNFKYYRNTGTATAPVFTEQTGVNNPLNGFDVNVSVSTGFATPTLGDLDGDGDLDLLAGEIHGIFKYYRNTGTATAPVFTEQTGGNNPLNGFDVNGAALSGFASPTLGDLDGDGDLDLVAGEFGGTFKYYRNTGTATAPVFTEQTGANNPLNGIVPGLNSALTPGDLDKDGDLDLIAGNSDGTFKYYRNNVAPTDIGLSNNSVAEKSASGTVVGNFSTTDLNEQDTFSYSLVSGTGSTDNAAFTIVGNQLFTASVFDFEVKSSYSVRVRTTDSSGGVFEKVFTINVTDVNDDPTDISLSVSSVPEMSPSDTPVGTFSTTDQDSGNTFSYSLVSGTGSTDNASFTIVGNQLRTSAVFDFEVKSSYSIRVKTTDSSSGVFEKVFTISITNVNEAPVVMAGFFPQLPNWWRKSKTNPGETVANVIDSVAPDQLITDQDAGALQGFAVIEATNLNGTWEYSTDGGSTWSSLADATTTTTNARLLDGSAKLRFVPFKKKFRGDVFLTAVAWDQTAGTNGGTADVTTRGDSTAFSVETSQIKQTVLKKKPQS